MKSILFTFLSILLFTCSLRAQENQDEQEIQTLIDLKKMKVGYFGAVQVGFSDFNDNSIITVGGRGGMVINHYLSLGFGGKGIVNMPKYYDIDETYGNGILEGGYGGLIIEPIVLAKKVIHLSFPVTIGAGGLFYMTERRYTHINNDGDEVMRRRTIDQDEFFILEPGVNLELNLTHFMRVCVGANYRWVPNLDLVATPSSAFNRLSTEITFKFGRF